MPSWATAYQYNGQIQFSASFSVFIPGETAEDYSRLLFFPETDGGESSNDIALAFYIQALIEF